MHFAAIELGFKLNEYMLVPMGENDVPGEPLSVVCERDVFDYLGMAFKEPHER